MAGFLTRFMLLYLPNKKMSVVKELITSSKEVLNDAEINSAQA